MTNTLNLLVAGGAAVAAAATQSLPLLAVGGAAYAALVAWDLTTRRKAAAFDELPDPARLSDPDGKRAVAALLAAHQELERVLADSPEGIARYLDLALASASELEDRAGRLALRLDELSKYLAGASAGAIRKELQSLQQSAVRTQDAEAREQFQSAASARQKQLQTLEEIGAARDRCVAHLSNLVATYESLPARVVHMRALDAQAADVMSGDLGKELGKVNQDIATFEETLKSLGERVPA